MDDHGNTRRWLLYIGMVILALAAILFSFFFRVMAGLGMYDFNYEIFHDILTKQQRAEIIRTMRAYISVPIYLLILTNMLWAGGTGVALFRKQRKKSQGNKEDGVGR